MKKLTYLLVALLLIVTACGQGATDHVDEDVNQGADLDQYADPEETEQASEVTESSDVTVGEHTPNEIDVVSPISFFYADAELTSIYRVENDAKYTKDKEGIQKTLQHWIDGPVVEGLEQLVPANVDVQSIDIKDNIVYISFSDEIRDVNMGSTGELFILEQIAMTVEQFGYDQVFVLINGEEVETLSGHMYLKEPYTQTLTPENYQH